jgi:hypothetical protein
MNVLFIYSYFSSELDKDFTHEFNNLRPNTIFDEKILKIRQGFE